MAFETLHLWISNNLSDERLNVDLLAERVGMSPRNFARSYKAKTGRTPAKAVEMFQLEAARRMLEDTEHGVDRIARSCGFGDEERMRTTFQRPRTWPYQIVGREGLCASASRAAASVAAALSGLAFS